MDASIQKLMDMYYNEEVKHFRESFYDSDEIFFDEFVAKLKEHVLYDLIMVCHKGEQKYIDEEIHELYEQIKCILECN